MNEFLTAGTIMTGLTASFGVILAVAHRVFHVEEDPRLEVVEGFLPGNNCGACAQPGCRAFAELLIQGEVQPSGCTVSAPAGLEAIATFLGVDAGSRIPTVARLRCAGGKSSVSSLADYQGIPSCGAAVLVNGGGKACAWGCLGLADCARVCDFDAIAMNAEGLPVVDLEKCTSCGDCVDICPRDLFEILPIKERLLVQCASPLTGDLARQICAVACDACGRCAADAEEGVIEMVAGLPVVRLPELGQVEATFRCPTGAIQWVEGGQLQGPVSAVLHHD